MQIPNKRFTLFATIVLTTTSITIANDSFLYNHLPFDEAQGTITYDATTNGNNGSLQGANWLHKGLDYHGLIFDGSNDYVDLSSLADDLRNKHSLTYSLWIKPDVITGAHTLFSLRNNTSSIRPRVGIVQINDSIQYEAVGISPDEFSVYGGRMMPKLWYHICIVATDDSTVLYVNGLKKKSGSGNRAPGDLLNNYGNCYLGRTVYTDVHYPYYGGMDDFRIYNKGLNHEEIRSLYRSYTDQLIFLPFSENTGNMAYDSTGNCHNGTLNGCSWAQNGIRNYCINFDGIDDYVQVDSLATDLRNVVQFSYVIWVKPDTLGGAHSLFSLRNNLNDERPRIEIVQSDNDLYYEAVNSGDDEYAVWSYDSLSTSAWRMVTVIADNDSTNIYVDTFAVARGNGSRAPGSLINEFSICRLGRTTFSSLHYPFDGKMNNLRVFRRRLTPSEIKVLFEKKM